MDILELKSIITAILKARQMTQQQNGGGRGGKMGELKDGIEMTHSKQKRGN